MDSRILQHIFQAWSQGNDECMSPALMNRFIEHAANRTGASKDDIRRTLAESKWFTFPIRNT
jgi:hypothetical protein